MRKLTEKGTVEANALSRRVYWLNWTLVILTAVLVFVGVAAAIATWWFWSHPHPLMATDSVLLRAV